MNTKAIFYYAQYIFYTTNINYWSPLTINLPILLFSPQLYNSFSSSRTPFLFVPSTSSKSASSLMANNLQLTSSLLRTWEFCSISHNVSTSSWTSLCISPGCSLFLPMVKHYNSGLLPTSKATLVSFGSFSRTTFQPGLSTSSAINTCSTWRGNENEYVEYMGWLYQTLAIWIHTHLASLSP